MTTPSDPTSCRHCSRPFRFHLGDQAACPYPSNTSFKPAPPEPEKKTVKQELPVDWAARPFDAYAARVKFCNILALIPRLDPEQRQAIAEALPAARIPIGEIGDHELRAAQMWAADIQADRIAAYKERDAAIKERDEATALARVRFEALAAAVKRAEEAEGERDCYLHNWLLRDRQIIELRAELASIAERQREAPEDAFRRGQESFRERRHLYINGDAPVAEYHPPAPEKPIKCDHGDQCPGHTSRDDRPCCYGVECPHYIPHLMPSASQVTSPMVPATELEEAKRQIGDLIILCGKLRDEKADLARDWIDECDKVEVERDRLRAKCSRQRKELRAQQQTVRLYKALAREWAVLSEVMNEPKTGLYPAGKFWRDEHFAKMREINKNRELNQENAKLQTELATLKKREADPSGEIDVVGMISDKGSTLARPDGFMERFDTCNAAVAWLDYWSRPQPVPKPPKCGTCGGIKRISRGFEMVDCPDCSGGEGGK